MKLLSSAIFATLLCSSVIIEADDFIAFDADDTFVAFDSDNFNNNNPNYGLLQGAEFDVGYAFGRFINIGDYAYAGLFTPVFVSDDFAPFVDISAYRFNNGTWAASAGFGIRQMLSEYSTVGVNAYYDYRRGWFDRNFSQFGLGFEWLNCCWDFRANAYLPFNTESRSTLCTFNQIGDGFFATQSLNEFAYRGFDAEVGFPLLSYCDFYLYGAAGPYYFCQQRFHSFWGVYGRLVLDLGKYVSLEMRVSSDNVYCTNAQGLIQINIPFDIFRPKSYDDCCNDYCDDCTCIQRVRRNNIILLDRCCNWFWNWDDRN